MVLRSRVSQPPGAGGRVSAGRPSAAIEVAVHFTRPSAAPRRPPRPVMATTPVVHPLAMATTVCSPLHQDLCALLVADDM